MRSSAFRGHWEAIQVDIDTQGMILWGYAALTEPRKVQRNGYSIVSDQRVGLIIHLEHLVKRVGQHHRKVYSKHFSNVPLLPLWGRGGAPWLEPFTKWFIVWTAENPLWIMICKANEMNQRIKLRCWAMPFLQPFSLQIAVFLRGEDGFLFISLSSATHPIASLTLFVIGWRSAK